MKKYFLVLLLLNNAYATDDFDDATNEALSKYAASHPIQPLPAVIEPIEYDLPESKWPKYKPREYAGKCKEPMALMETCESPLQQKIKRLNATLKAKADAKRKLIKEHEKSHNDRFGNTVNKDKCNNPNFRCS